MDIMREKLINIIRETKLCDGNDCVNCTTCKYEDIADRLISNGVIVPPCKIGNTVWWVDKNRVLDMVCVGFMKTHKKFLVAIARNTNVFTTHYYVEWNVDIFLTKEEAEQTILKKEKGK